MSINISPFHIIDDVGDFLDLGGGVLWVLMALSFLLALAIIYDWLSRKSMNAHTRKTSLAHIKMMVRLAPLLGLLGTVTGMMNVFEVVAVSGASNARALAEAQARATLPTMAGMTIAILGLLFITLLERQRSSQESSQKERS